MATSVTWNGTAYSVPAAGEVNWASLSAFLIDLGTNAETTNVMKHTARIALTTPVSVSDTSDFAVITNLTTPGAVAVNLPAITVGRVFIIKDGKGDAGTNNITITPNGADTIGGAATLVLNHNNQVVVLVATAGNWNVVLNSLNDPNLISNPMSALGDTMYGGASPAGIATRLAGNTTSTKKFLQQTGTGAVSAAPVWDVIAAADLPASTASVKGAYTPGQTPGIADNSAASAGNVGEYIESTAGSGTSLSDSTASDANCSKITLGAGTWDIQATIIFTPAATTSVNRYTVFIGTATGNDLSGIDTLRNCTTITPNVVVGATASVLCTPVYRVRLSTNTDYYVKAYAVFSISTMTAQGAIMARRVR